MGLFEKVFFHKPVIQVISQYLSLIDIILISSTCRLLKWKWIDSMAVPLEMKERVRKMFGWKYDCMKQFNANVVSALVHNYPCMGGCGSKKKFKKEEIVCRTLCKYVLCNTCFSHLNIQQYMLKRKFISHTEITSKHLFAVSLKLSLLVRDFILINDFLSEYCSYFAIMDIYRNDNVLINKIYYVKEYIVNAKIEEITKDINKKFKDFAVRSLLNAQMRERNAENDLKNAKELVISRKRTLEELNEK